MLPRARGFGYPGQPRHGHAGTVRVAGAQQGPEVETVQRPQRCDDQVVPAAVVPLTAGAEVVLASKPNLRPAQQTGRSAAMSEREAINTNVMFEGA